MYAVCRTPRHIIHTVQAVLIRISLVNMMYFVFCTLCCQLSLIPPVIFWYLDVMLSKLLYMKHALMTSVVFLGGERRDGLKRTSGTVLCLHACTGGHGHMILRLYVFEKFLSNNFSTHFLHFNIKIFFMTYPFIIIILPCIALVVMISNCNYLTKLK